MTAMGLTDYNGEDEMSHAIHKANGNDAYRRKDYRSAIANYTLAISEATSALESLSTQVNNGKDLSREGNMPTPQSFITEKDLDALKQTVASYHTNRAAAFSMLLLYKDSLSDCDAALRVDPSWSKAHVRKAKAYTALGQLSDAIKEYSLGMIRDPNDAALVKEKQDLIQLKQRFDECEAIVGKLSYTDPFDPSNANNLNFNLSTNDQKQKKRDAKQSLAQIEIVLASCPNWIIAQLYKVASLVYLSRTSEAYSLTTTLMRRMESSKSDAIHSTNSITNSVNTNSLDDSQTLKLLYLRSQCLYDMGNLDDAVKHLRQILLRHDLDCQKASNFFKFLKGLGKLKLDGDGKYKSRDFVAALGTYTSAIDLSCWPRMFFQDDIGNGETKGGFESKKNHPVELGKGYRAKLFFNRASTNANLRNHSKVVEDCTHAIQLDDAYCKAYLRRAGSNLVLGGEKECRQAVKDYEKALELTSTNNCGTGSNGQTKDPIIRDIEEKLRKARIQLKRCSQTDLYKVLNVARDATDTEIRKSYRKLALQWHPDRHASSSEEKQKEAQEKFRIVNLAYEVLSDPQKKKRYDDGVDEQDLDNPHATAPSNWGGTMGGSRRNQPGAASFGGVDPNYVFQMFMNQHGGSQRGGFGGGGGFPFV